MRKGQLNRFDIMALVIGSIIGWGSFSLPGSKFLTQSGVINTALGLFLGAGGVVLIQAGYHTMLKRHTKTGGEFTYTMENLGPGHGFTAGWSLILCYLSMIPLNATAFILVLKNIFGDKVSYGYLYSVAGYPVYTSEILIADAVILLFFYVNMRGLKMSSRVQNTMVVLLVANLTVLFIFMIFAGDQAQFNANYLEPYVFDAGQIAKVVAIIPFLYVGFDVVPQVASDLNFAPSKATRFTVVSIVIGVLMYNFTNVIAAMAFTPSEALGANWAVGQAVLDYAGTLGFVLLVLALLGAVIGGINGFMIASSKLVYSLADHRLMPRKYARVKAGAVLPNALAFVTGVALIAPFFGREVIIYIVDMASVLAAIAYAYVCFIGLRHAGSRREQFKVAVGFLVALTFMGLLLIPGSPGRLTDMSLILLVCWAVPGFLYYHMARGRLRAAGIKAGSPLTVEEHRELSGDNAL